MPITPKNLVKHELIGLKAEVIKSTDSGKIGLKGAVVHETKGTIVLETEKGEKRLPKKECVFRFSLQNEKVDVAGEKLIGSPEERLKKQHTEKW